MFYIQNQHTVSSHISYLDKWQCQRMRSQGTWVVPRTRCCAALGSPLTVRANRFTFPANGWPETPLDSFSVSKSRGC